LRGVGVADALACFLPPAMTQPRRRKIAALHNKSSGRTWRHRNLLRRDPSPGRHAPQLHQILLAHRREPRHGIDRAATMAARWRPIRASRDLDARAGVHLLFGELHPFGASAGEGRRAVDDLARLRHTIMAAAAIRPRRFSPRPRKNIRANIFSRRRQSPLNEGGMFCIDGGKPFVEKLKWMAEDASAIIAWAPARPGAACRRPSPIRPRRRRSTRSFWTSRSSRCRDARDRRGDDWRHHLHHHFREVARTRPQGGQRCSIRSASTTNAIGGRISTPGNSSRSGTTRTRARATAFIRWAARADDLQRLLHRALERRRVLPDSIGTRCIGCSEEAFGTRAVL